MVEKNGGMEEWNVFYRVKSHCLELPPYFAWFQELAGFKSCAYISFRTIFSGIHCMHVTTRLTANTPLNVNGL